MKQFARVILILSLAIFYVLFPYDILPDILGRIGRIDDVVLLFLLIFWYFIKPAIDEMKYNHSPSFQKENQTDSQTDDPYEILGVDRDADIATIRRAYHEKIKQYHPDLVAEMGPEIQELARQKSLKINKAYHELMMKNS